MMNNDYNKLMPPNPQLMAKFKPPGDMQRGRVTRHNHSQPIAKYLFAKASEVSQTGRVYTTNFA